MVLTINIEKELEKMKIHEDKKRRKSNRTSGSS